MFVFDSTFIILIPALILTVYAQYKVQSTYSKYSKIYISSERTGKDIARKVLETEGLSLPIEETPGKLTDHYDPIKKVLRLSPQVYNGKSIAAAAIAAHEAGHAIQHAKSYKPLVLRTASYPLARFASFGGPILFLIGFIFASKSMLLYGIIIYSLAVFFYLITLPVELDASSRAKTILENNGFVLGSEKEGVRKMLNSAALTYIAAALMAIVELLRLIILYRSRD
jgi:uncharacterized protein